MKSSIIGREQEIKILDRLISSREPELLAIYGRRRVGKTFLIKSHYHKRIIFSCTGQHNGKTRQQLINFTEQLNLYFPKKRAILTPHTWQEAFQILRECIDSLNGDQKKVVFFDELPWLDTHKSGFLSAFGYFWNAYAAQREDILVVICGSAASWIIDKIVNSKGGLHNRITQRIRLLPFTLKETENYLKHRNSRLDHYQILQLYMVMGGVPAYLNTVDRGLSAEQNIERCCFSKDGVLANEFNNLYAALFSNPNKHIEVIRALARKNKGLTRNEILQTSQLLTGGGITTVLNELTESGFIEKTYPFGKKEKDSLFRLIDEFSLFYLKFMQKRHSDQKNAWRGVQRSQAYASWCGYAFENICIKHISQVRKALQIGGVHAAASSWHHVGKNGNNGAQIDLLLDRADQCINICEIKFNTKHFIIDKRYASALQNKMTIFRQTTNTKKTLFLTFITTYGVYENDYKNQRVDSEVTMDDLFV